MSITVAPFMMNAISQLHPRADYIFVLYPPLIERDVAAMADVRKWAEAEHSILKG